MACDMFDGSVHGAASIAAHLIAHSITAMKAGWVGRLAAREVGGEGGWMKVTRKACGKEG